MAGEIPPQEKKGVVEVATQKVEEKPEETFRRIRKKYRKEIGQLTQELERLLPERIQNSIRLSKIEKAAVKKAGRLIARFLTKVVKEEIDKDYSVVFAKDGYWDRSNLYLQFSIVDKEDKKKLLELKKQNNLLKVSYYALWSYGLGHLRIVLYYKYLRVKKLKKNILDFLKILITMRKDWKKYSKLNILHFEDIIEYEKEKRKAKDILQKIKKALFEGNMQELYASLEELKTIENKEIRYRTSKSLLRILKKFIKIKENIKNTPILLVKTKDGDLVLYSITYESYEFDSYYFAIRTKNNKLIEYNFTKQTKKEIEVNDFEMSDECLNYLAREIRKELIEKQKEQIEKVYFNGIGYQ